VNVYNNKSSLKHFPKRFYIHVMPKNWLQQLVFLFKNDNFDLFEQLESNFIKLDNLGFLFITGDMNFLIADEYDFILYAKYLEENNKWSDKNA